LHSLNRISFVFEKSRLKRRDFFLLSAQSRGIIKVSIFRSENHQMADFSISCQHPESGM